MTTLQLLNRGFSTSRSVLPNNRRSVSDMDENQRKAVMAKLGGGGAAGGYTGGARGGRRGPERNPTPMYVTPEGHARAVREAQIGIQSDITPFDLLASTALEAGLDGITQARMNTDNKWVDAALGVAALGLFAAGVKNARTQQALAKHVSAQKTVDNVLEQMGRDATRFDSMLKGTPSSVGEDVYRTYDQLAERVTRARGYPPSAAEANRWLDKVAPKVSPTSPARGPTVVEDVKAFRADTLRTTGVAATDNDVATYLLKKHPESYTPPKNYIPPKSSAGDAFRSEAAKTMGSQQAQYLDYARRADMEAVKPRIVKDPWQSTKDVISRISNKELHMNAPLAPALRLVKNAIHVTHGFIANAGPMTDEQRRAMFAGGGGRGPARGSSSASIGRIKGSTQNFNSSYSGPKKQTTKKELVSYKPYQKEMSAFEKWQLTPNGMKSDAVPPNAGPEYYAARTVANYDRFKKEFPADQNPPKEWLAVHPEWKPTKPSSVPTQYPWSHDFVMSDGTLTYGGGGDRQVQAPLTFPTNKSGIPSQRELSPGGGTSKTDPVYYLPPNKKGIGYYNPNQPYVPGQPRIDERGNKIYGPKPGEPGFIDIGKWREGANPRGPGVPISKPTPVTKK